MTTNHELFLIVAVTLLCLTGVSVQQDPGINIITHPQNITAKEGDTVILECHFAIPVYCSWLRSGAPIRVGEKFEKYSYLEGTSATSKTDCSMQISPVTRNDFTNWRCSNQITDEVQVSVLSELAWLSQQKSPRRPKIVLNGTEIQELKLPIRDIGQPLNLTCISEHGNPAANLTWQLGNRMYTGTMENIPTGEHQYTATLLWDEANNGWTLFEGHAELSCVANHPLYITPATTKLRFLRDYATKNVQVDAEGRVGEEFGLTVGEQIKFSCKADGEPQPSYIWEYLDANDQWVKYATEAIITVEAEDKRYRCSARNRINTEAIMSKIFVVRRREADTSGFGVIIAIVIAVIIFLALLLVGIIFLYRRKKWFFAPKAASVPTTLDAEAADQDNEKTTEKTPFSDSQAEPQYENLKQNGKEEEINGKTDHSPMKNDQNDNKKPAEIVYAQLDLSKRGNAAVKPPPEYEKTEYAEIAFNKDKNNVNV